MENETIVTKFAKFCCGLRFEDLEKRVVDKIKQLILDQLAVEIACAVLPWNKELYDYICMLDARGPVPWSVMTSRPMWSMPSWPIRLSDMALRLMMWI